MNLNNAHIYYFLFTVISHTKSSYYIIICSIFYVKFVNMEPLNKDKIFRKEYCKVCLGIHFWKLAHFDKIYIFQFMTNFTKNSLVSHIVKLQLCAAPLEKNIQAI